MPDIRLEQVTKLYESGGRSTAAVMNIDLEIAQGEFVFFVGGRGAGKSTLLDIISGEAIPERGRVYLDGAGLGGPGPGRRRRLSRCFGRVTQDPSLARTDTVYANLTGHEASESPTAEEQLVRKALGLVGMAGAEGRLPRQLTYDQCRRVELARAILRSPPVLLLDGITQGLEDAAAWDLLLLLGELNARGTTVIVTADSKQYPRILRRRAVTLSHGKIVGDGQEGGGATLHK